MFEILNELWSKPLEFRIMYLIWQKAAKEKTMLNGIEISKGQWLSSLRNLQDELTYYHRKTTKKPGIASVKRAMEYLEDNHYIHTQNYIGTLLEHLSPNSGTLITIPKLVDSLENTKTASLFGNTSGTPAIIYGNTLEEHGTPYPQDNSVETKENTGSENLLWNTLEEPTKKKEPKKKGTSTYISTSTSIKSKNRASIAWPESLNTSQCRSTWNEWIDYRKQKNFPRYAPITIKKIFNKWGKRPATDFIKSMEQSIENDWRGLFEPQQDNGHKKPEPTRAREIKTVGASSAFATDMVKEMGIDIKGIGK